MLYTSRCTAPGAAAFLRDLRKSYPSASLRSAGEVFACRGMFSFDTKREPEKCQRFRRAGATKKGLLAPFNPKEEGYTGKN